MSDEREVIVVEHKPENEDKPWHVSLEGVGTLEKARAILNFPGRDFATQEEAEETANKIRDLLKSDEVQVRDDDASTPAPPATPGIASAEASTTSGSENLTQDPAITSAADSASVVDPPGEISNPFVGEPDVPPTQFEEPGEPVRDGDPAAEEAVNVAEDLPEDDELDADAAVLEDFDLEESPVPAPPPSVQEDLAGTEHLDGDSAVDSENDVEPLGSSIFPEEPDPALDESDDSTGAQEEHIRRDFL